MKVSSPIGDLPFEPRRIHLGRGGIRIDGAMGAWPATVHVTAHDIPGLSRVLAGPLFATAAAAVTVIGVARVARAGRRNS